MKALKPAFAKNTKPGADDILIRIKIAALGCKGKKQ